MSREALIDAPKLLRDPMARTARQAELYEPHIAPLTEFVEKLRAEVGSHGSIPNFDPWDGGIDAEILFLLEAPGARALFSGFISRNNPDESAKNFFELNRDAEIPRKRTVTWNIVPWYIGTGTRIRAAGKTDTDAGIRALTRVLDLLPKLRAAILMGRKAERASELLAQLRPAVRVFKSPHPSPLFVNNAPGNMQRILDVFLEVAKYLTLGALIGALIPFFGAKLF
jgi:uracil-DNA glycosylase